MLHMSDPLEPDLWARVERLFSEALDLPEGERADHLRRASESDPRVIAEVEGLLAHADTRIGDRMGNLVAAAQGEVRPIGAVGLKVGPYRLTAEIGRGGMGVVYLGVREDSDFEQTVAVKLLPGGLYSEEMSWRFRNERRILASLEHPAIARFLDGGSTPEGIPYVVMEYVDGRPVDRFCDEDVPDLDARLDLFLQICDAVRHAHAKLVIHRDIKPANILVDRTGTPRLLDFGIAKLLEPGDPEAAGTRIMSPRFASPEQVSGGTATVATDVYALGGLLYLLLTGRHPHDAAATPAELASRITDTDPEPPSIASGDGSLAGDLDTIVLTAMRRDPAERYPSVDRLMQDVTAFRRSLPISARPPTLGYRARKFVRRNRAAVVAAIVATSAVLGGAGAATAGMLRARDAEAEAVQEARVAAEVSDFLVGLFGESDPENSLGEEATARDLLDRGVERIDAELSGQPALQARLKHVMAGSYGALDDFARSEQLYREGLALAGTPELRATIARSLVGVLRYTDEYDEAFIVLDTLLAEVEPAVDTTDARSMQRTPELSDALAAALQERGLLHADLGDSARAFADLERGARLRERLGGPDVETVGRSVTWVAIGYNRFRRFEDAVPLYRRALAIFEPEVDPRHPAILEATEGLAATYAALGRFDSASVLFEEILPRQRDVYGPEDAQTVQTIANLGSMLADMGRLEEAEPLLLEALEIRTRIFGDGLPTTTVLNNLARLRQRQGNYAEAEALWTRATAIRRDMLGRGHPAAVSTLLGMANMRRLQENWAGSAEAYEEAIGYLRGSGPVAPEALTDYGQVLRVLGRIDEAEALEAEALQVEAAAEEERDAGAAPG
jgi:eukaryotic-like serine/threonine-protein kinase